MTELANAEAFKTAEMAVALAEATAPNHAYPNMLADALALAITEDVKKEPTACVMVDTVVDTADTLAEKENRALALEMAVAEATTDEVKAFAPTVMYWHQVVALAVTDEANWKTPFRTDVVAAVAMTDDSTNAIRVMVDTLVAMA